MSPQAPVRPPGDGVDWSLRSVDEVIDYILERYHVVLRRELAELAGLADAVRSAELVQRPTLVAPLLEKVSLLAEELTQHMVKEERLAFRMIRAAGGFVGVPLSVMEHEHRLAHELLDEIRGLTDGWTVPQGGSAALARLYRLMRKVEADLEEHSALEDGLFARARASSLRRGPLP